VAIATQARQSSVNYIDETSWYCLNTLHWLWVMASERVAFYILHSAPPWRRSSYFLRSIFSTHRHTQQCYVVVT